MGWNAKTTNTEAVPVATWDPDSPERDPVKPSPRIVYVTLDEISDGRCKASSWRAQKPKKTTYENLFGPGGYNRCIGPEGHVNPRHKDEWGWVFEVSEDGKAFRSIRREHPS